MKKKKVDIGKKVNIKTMKKISLIILIFVFLALGNEALAASADLSNATISILSQQKKQIRLVISNLRRTGWGWLGAETITTSSPQQIVNSLPLPAAPRTGWGWRRRADTNLLLINPLPAGSRTRWGWRGPADAHLPTPSNSEVTELGLPDSALPNPVEQKRTGGTIQIPAKKVVRFKAGSELASKVN